MAAIPKLKVAPKAVEQTAPSVATPEATPQDIAKTVQAREVINGDALAEKMKTNKFFALWADKSLSDQVRAERIAAMTEIQPGTKEYEKVMAEANDFKYFVEYRWAILAIEQMKTVISEAHTKFQATVSGATKNLHDFEKSVEPFEKTKKVMEEMRKNGTLITDVMKAMEDMEGAKIAHENKVRETQAAYARKQRERASKLSEVTTAQEKVDGYSSGMVSQMWNAKAITSDKADLATRKAELAAVDTDMATLRDFLDAPAPDFKEAADKDVISILNLGDKDFNDKIVTLGNHALDLIEEIYKQAGFSVVEMETIKERIAKAKDGNEKINAMFSVFKKGLQDSYGKSKLNLDGLKEEMGKETDELKKGQHTRDERRMSNNMQQLSQFTESVVDTTQNVEGQAAEIEESARTNSLTLRAAEKLRQTGVAVISNELTGMVSGLQQAAAQHKVGLFMDVAGRITQRTQTRFAEGLENTAKQYEDNNVARDAAISQMRMLGETMGRVNDRIIKSLQEGATISAEAVEVTDRLRDATTLFAGAELEAAKRGAIPRDAANGNNPDAAPVASGPTRPEPKKGAADEAAATLGI